MEVDSREVRIEFADVANDWLNEIAPRYARREMRGDSPELHRLIMLSALANRETNLVVYIERYRGTEGLLRRFWRRYVRRI